jgi:hypothetical protein
VRESVNPMNTSLALRLVDLVVRGIPPPAALDSQKGVSIIRYQ